MLCLIVLVDERKLPENRANLQDRQFYATCGETCYFLSQQECQVVEELKSCHEEADIRMFLHANNASQNEPQTVVIVSEDTYVMILCVGYCKKINCFLYQKCGTQNQTRYMNISNLAQLLGDNLCDALAGIHAFTGCDSVSAFAGQGKLSAPKLVRGNSAFKESFNLMGTSWEVSQELYMQQDGFICLPDVCPILKCIWCQRSTLSAVLHQNRWSGFQLTVPYQELLTSAYIACQLQQCGDIAWKPSQTNPS